MKLTCVELIQTSNFEKGLLTFQILKTQRTSDTFDKLPFVYNKISNLPQFNSKFLTKSDEDETKITFKAKPKANNSILTTLLNAKIVFLDFLSNIVISIVCLIPTNSINNYP
jgi:hypothetical protein